ncbi:MAG: phosphosulfolactate synthase, partial [Candidatus Nanohaloarchaea archaeon]|nr:phosphosulfolactate synthase [Candidatus Nanohaloarchaea archaeon]
MSEKAFSFLDMYELPPKPRDTHVIEMRGPYYYTLTHGHSRHILEDWGHLFDGYKFSGGSFRLLERQKLKQFIDLCHEHDVYVSTGGAVESIVGQGEEAVTRYFEECKELGFDVVEISSGIAQIPLESQLNMVRKVQELGMKAKGEIALMKGAGAGVHATNYEEKIDLKPVDQYMEEAQAHLDAGAYMLMIESEGLTEGLPPEKWRIDVIEKLIDRFGYENLMFEAAEPEVFKWYLQNVGKDVNLFIDNSQIVEFNCWRSGIWGDDQDLWAGGDNLEYTP